MTQPFSARSLALLGGATALALLLQRLPVAWTRRVAVLLALGGGVAAQGPAGLLIR
jgi:hypothetical protein